MSKTGQWVLEMQEDAWELTRDEFIAKHGEHNVDVWDQIKAEINESVYGTGWEEFEEA
jgi:hypothetical protein